MPTTWLANARAYRIARAHSPHPPPPPHTHTHTHRCLRVAIRMSATSIAPEAPEISSGCMAEVREFYINRYVCVGVGGEEMVWAYDEIRGGEGCSSR